MNNIFVAFSIVGAAAVAPAMAVAAPYTVHGSVLDAMTAETLPGASCAFYAANDTVKPLLTLMTGADGSFTADLPRPGEYLMKVTLVSQKPVSRSLVLTDENPAVDLGTIAMQPEGEALEEVVITGRRPVIEATGDKVAYNLTEDPNTQTHTVLEMLRKVPMVTVDAQDNIYINGQSNFKIYLNGKEDPMLGQNASTILKSLPATSIKRIEVILDPGAKYDAEGVGGILNIITETQASTDGQMATITVGGGANNAQASVYGMAKKNKVTASVDVSYYKRFGYREDKGGIERETFDVPSPTVTRQEIAQRQNNHFVNGNARLSWEPNDKNLFTISASGYGGGGKNHYRTTTDVFGDNGLLLSHSRQKLTSKWIWSSITVNAGYQHNFDDKGQNLVLSYQYVGGWNKDKDRTTTLESSFDDFVPYTYDYTNAPTNEHTVQLDYTKPFSQYFTLEAGAKGIFRRNTSDGYTKIGDSWSDMTLTDHNTVDMTQNQDVAAAYATYAGTFGRFSLRAGLRYEYTRMRVDFKTEGYDSFHSNFNDWVPNASLGYSFTPTQNLYASYQQRIRRPGVSELNPHRTLNTSTASSARATLTWAARRATPWLWPTPASPVSSASTCVRSIPSPTTASAATPTKTPATSYIPTPTSATSATGASALSSSTRSTDAWTSPSTPPLSTPTSASAHRKCRTTAGPTASTPTTITPCPGRCTSTSTAASAPVATTCRDTHPASTTTA